MVAAKLRAGVNEANHVKAEALDVAGKIVTNQLFIGNIDVAKRLEELSAKVESQAKEIDDLKKTVEELRKRW